MSNEDVVLEVQLSVSVETQLTDKKFRAKVIVKTKNGDTYTAVRSSDYVNAFLERDPGVFRDDVQDVLQRVLHDIAYFVGRNVDALTLLVEKNKNG